MIKADQPTVFGTGLIVALSSVTDGTMKYEDSDDPLVTEYRRKFLSRHMIAIQSTVLCGVNYDGDNFTRYTRVREQDKGRGMVPDTDKIIADGIATDVKRCALFLPLADCTGAILYDPKRSVLMVSHLGRHSSEQYGAQRSIEFMSKTFGTRPEDVIAWLSPAPNGTDYPIWKRDNKSAHDVTRDDLRAAGVLPDNVASSLIDTVSDENYFSHSEFLKGNRKLDGRYAIVAMMR